VKVTVTDAIGLIQTLDYRLVIAQTLAVVKRSLPTAKVGRAYHARLFALGGVSPKGWTIVSGKLPAGLHLKASTGFISGTARHAGTSHITIQVKDKLGAVSRATFTLRVRA
jgi:hypothetical protein